MKSVLIAAVALVLGIGTAAAGTDNHKFDKGHPPGFSEGNKTGWDYDKHPPGWDEDRGIKQGWDEKKDHPPDLEAKKDDYKRDKY